MLQSIVQESRVITSIVYHTLITLGSPAQPPPPIFNKIDAMQSYGYLSISLDSNLIFLTSYKAMNCQQSRN